MRRPTFHITTSDGRTVFPDIEIVETGAKHKLGVIPNDFRINGVSMYVDADSIDIAIGPEELTAVTVTLFAKSVTIKQEEAA